MLRIWTGHGIPTELAHDHAGLDYGRQREQSALDHENHGDRATPGVLATRRDYITLRGIVAHSLTISPNANREPLASA